MFRHFSLLSGESLESSVVVKDSNLCNFARWFVKLFSIRHQIGSLRGHLLRARKMLHEARLDGQT